ncbi:hypothetical protein [Ancylobacter rudongensis]|uniref:hypothetical protein n=1 Tax=Ancylobacter rudongensis TaxID=177413 RepID=UPI00115FF2B1|nr:hypothetical protein [Ancylobacter rudongensis]
MSDEEAHAAFMARWREDELAIKAFMRAGMSACEARRAYRGVQDKFNRFSAITEISDVVFIEYDNCSWAFRLLGPRPADRDDIPVFLLESSVAYFTGERRPLPTGREFRFTDLRIE